MPSKHNSMLEGFNAAGDALEMDLDMWPSYPHEVYGESVRVLNLFGTNIDIMPTVIESKVDLNRGIIILVSHLMGNLYCCLLTDTEQSKMTMFVLDGPKAGLKPDYSKILPKFWLREDLYHSLVPALKATYEKSLFEKTWNLKHKGKAWMESYLEQKTLLKASKGIEI